MEKEIKEKIIIELLRKYNIASGELMSEILELTNQTEKEILEGVKKIVWEAANKYPDIPLEARGNTWHEIIRVRDTILEKLKELKK